MIDLPAGTLVAIYGRTSGDRQKKEETIKTQVKELLKECERLDLVVVEVYRDPGVPNWVPIEERPDGQRLLADGQAGKFEAVLVLKSGRLARDPIVFHHNRRLLGRFGVSVCYLMDDLDFETPEGRFTSGIKLLVNDYEKDSQGELMLLGRYRIAEEDLYTGGVVPYGYRRVPVGRRSRLEICPVEAPRVARIYCLHVHERQSARQIARLFTAEGVPTAVQNHDNGYRGHRENLPTYGTWSAQMVSKLLRQSVYRGLKPFGGGKKEKVFQKVPAIVSEELWQAAQVRLDEGRSLSKRNTKHDYLLARKIYCSQCGKLYTGKTSQKGPRTYHYYECGAHRPSQYPHRPVPPCIPVPRFQCGWVDDDCWKELVAHLKDGEGTLARIKEQWVGEDEHYRTLTERRTDLLRKRAELENERLLAKRGKSRIGLDFTPKEAQTLLEELDGEIDRLDADAEEVTGQMGQVASRESRLQQAEQNLRYWAPRVTGDLSFHARRHLVELFVDRVEVHWEEDGTIAFAYDFVFDPLAYVPGEEGSKGGQGVSIAGHTSERMAHYCNVTVSRKMGPVRCADAHSLAASAGLLVGSSGI